MAYGTRVKFSAVRELDFGDISGSYAALGTPLAEHVRLIRLVSTFDDEVYVSMDGTTDQVRLAQGSFLLLDLSANRVRDDGLFIPVGTQFYVKSVGSDPTSGSIWLEVLYAEGGV